MGMKLPEEQSLYSDLDENFDPLQYEAREAADMNNRQNCDIPLTNTKHAKTNADDISEQVKDNVDPCEEEDEEEDDFVQKGKSLIRLILKICNICSLLRDIHFDYDSNQNRRGLLE